MVQIIYLDKRQQIVIVILVHHQQSVAHHMQSHRELLLALYCFHYISMIFIILQNGLNFTYLQIMQTSFINMKAFSNFKKTLINIQTWLCANKLYLNIEKSNFTPFHPPQKMSQDSSLNLNCMQQAIEKRIL